MNFLKTSNDECPFHVKWYEGENEIVCGHAETSKSDDECAKCQNSYNDGEKWFCCPARHQWCNVDCFL